MLWEDWNNSMNIIIPGKPIAKKRPRFARRGKFVVAYNDQQTEEGKWILTARQQIQGAIPEGLPITLRCIFYMPIPKSTPKKKITTYHIKKPDLDNLVKFVKDCLNGELWHDDSQVSELFAGKFYDENPRTELIIEW
jgi:Holliday junction resolvase RusA-like endonuclease